MDRTLHCSVDDIKHVLRTCLTVSSSVLNIRAKFQMTVKSGGFISNRLLNEIAISFSLNSGVIIIFALFSELFLYVVYLFEPRVQVKNESVISATENSCSVTAANIFGQRYKKIPSVLGADMTELCAVNTVSLSPPITRTTSVGHWLNRSLPVQSRCRVYSEDGSAAASRGLRRGRPNSLKSGLPSPLHHSLLVSAGTSVPVVCSREAVVIDTSPILSTCSVTSAGHDSNKHFATVINDRSGSTLVHSGSKVSLNPPMETTMDDSAHNQAFTESMLADPDVDSSSVDAADASYMCASNVEHDKDLTTCEMSESQLSVVQLSCPARSGYSDPAVKAVQSSTTSLDSAVDAGHMSENDCQLDVSHLNIPRSFSKQSIISHDSGVGMADPYPSTCHATDTGDKLSPQTDWTSFSREGLHCIGLRSSVRRQSVRFSPNLQVTTDVRNLLFKAGVPLETVSDRRKENAEKPISGMKSQCSSSNKTITSDCEHTLESHESPDCCVNLPSGTTTSSRQSKLLPVLPISTSLVRLSHEQYSASAKRCVTNLSSSAAAVASPAVSVGRPQIKSALLTPSFKQCLSGIDATSQLRSRLRGKPVKRLQSSPYPNHSPVNPLSPRHVTTSAHTTVAVPFNLDV